MQNVPVIADWMLETEENEQSHEVPDVDGGIRMGDQVWEQEDKISSEGSVVRMPTRWPVLMPKIQLDYVERAREGRARMGSKGNYWLLVLEVYTEKRGKRGPEPREHRTGEWKPGKKTDTHQENSVFVRRKSNIPA